MIYENLVSFKDMETLETILVQDGQVIEAQPYDYTDPFNIPKYSVGFMENDLGIGCTAWVSSIVNTPFSYIYSKKTFNVIATAITAAHTIYLNSSAREKLWMFHVDPLNFKPESSFYAAPFLDFVDETDTQLDPITMCKYSLPGDSMIFLIFETPNTTVSLKPLQITTRELQEGEEVVLFGYPGTPREPYLREALCPLVIRHPEIRMEDIRRAICGGKRLVKSLGNILKRGDLLCVSCTSMGVMSGSPACIVENGEYKVAGILVGGACAPFQRELIRILRCITRREIVQAEQLLNELINSLDAEKYSDIRGLRDFISLIGIKNKYAFKALLDFYLSLLPTYAQIDDPYKTNHNLLLSITSTAMRQAVSTSDFLSNVERR